MFNDYVNKWFVFVFLMSSKIKKVSITKVFCKRGRLIKRKEEKHTIKRKTIGNFTFPPGQ